MTHIGKRVSLTRKEKELSIVIISLADDRKNTYLLIWFLLWTFSGMIVLWQYFKLTDLDTKTAVIVWMGFWVYFEYKIFNAYLWRKFGKEKIKIHDKKLFYKIDTAGRGKIKEYESTLIKNLHVIESKENSFFENLNNSYWATAGEKLAFDYNEKEIKFGKQLEDADAIALLKVIKNELKN